MTDRAALQGQLVDIRNVGTHKSVKLTIHVPEELALSVTEMFGWPTAVNPVSVALARLVEQKKPEQTERRRWHELPVVQQAGIRCNEVAFWQFLAFKLDRKQPENEKDAATILRNYFKVNTRKDIPAGPWNELEGEYQLWSRVA
jgi:hypothetical protein